MNGATMKTYTVRPRHVCKMGYIDPCATHVIYINGCPRYYVTKYEGMLCVKRLGDPPSGRYTMTKHKLLTKLLEDVKQGNIE